MKTNSIISGIDELIIVIKKFLKILSVLVNKIIIKKINNCLEFIRFWRALEWNKIGIDIVEVQIVCTLQKEGL